MFKIVKREEMAEGTVILNEIVAPRIASKANPGQFVILKANEEGERIPLTMAETDPQKGTITIIYLVVGKSTALFKTLLVGEKYLQPEQYFTGEDDGDNNSMYQGNDYDVNRWASQSRTPRQDTRGYNGDYSIFGSAHPGAVNACHVDGSVHSHTYDIDPELWNDLGRRNQSQTGR